MTHSANIIFGKITESLKKYFLLQKNYAISTMEMALSLVFPQVSRLKAEDSVSSTVGQTLIRSSSLSNGLNLKLEIRVSYL